MKFLQITTLFIFLTAVTRAQLPNPLAASKTNNIIFEDNFNDDTVGKFPHKWEMFKNVYSTKVLVAESSGEKELHIESEVHLHPLIEPLINVGDGLKAELEYKPDSINETFSIWLSNNTNPKEGNYVYIIDNDNIYIQLYCNSTLSKREHFTHPLATHKWHKVTYAVKRGLLTLCIDTNCYHMRNEAVVIPEVSVLTFNFVGNASIKNVKISTVNNTRDFTPINSGNKIVTHAINFAKGKYSITPFSYAYIKDLATWLNTNPTIELEIDGHTDNDGDKTINISLSLSRANEVKRALVANGVAASRLTTKGYGACMPIDTGNTPAAKAMNRRVEFIKIR